MTNPPNQYQSPYSRPSAPVTTPPRKPPVKTQWLVLGIGATVIGVFTTLFFLLVVLVTFVPVDPDAFETAKPQESNRAKLVKEDGTVYVQAKGYPIRVELPDGLHILWTVESGFRDEQSEADNTVIQLKDILLDTKIVVRAVTKSELSPESQDLEAFGAADYSRNMGLLPRSEANASARKNVDEDDPTTYRSDIKVGAGPFSAKLIQTVRYIDTGNYFVVVEVMTPAEVSSDDEHMDEIDAIVKSIEEF